MLHFEAAAAFQDMKATAAQVDISLIPISGFRSTGYQSELFVSQVDKQGSESAAAQLSAPPGYSEHHTGYAIDIGDDDRPDADVKYAFETTRAYQWLQENAISFGFEESFPRNNSQGINFEPWHWRYVGSKQAASTFAISKELYK